jgi:hypothetical protein
MSYRVVCPECSWSVDVSTLPAAGRHADEHREETGHEPKIDRRLLTDGGESQTYEVVVGFAGGSRTVVEVVEAETRGEAATKACDGHGITAVSQEVLRL